MDNALMKDKVSAGKKISTILSKENIQGGNFCLSIDRTH